jgi:Tfp pilus assembly protein PilX
MRRPSLYRTFGNERGILLVVVLMVMTILLAVTAAGLVMSRLSAKAAANLKLGTGAVQAADAGIQHALALIPAGGDFDSFWAGTGLANFPCKNSSGSTGTCDGTTYKPTLTASLNGYGYTVVVENDVSVSGETATNDSNKIIILTSTATDPNNNSKRKVRAYIGRSPWIPPGTIYVPGDPTYIETRFNGNSFGITGRDSNPGQGEGSGSADPIPGIATTDSGTTIEITGVSGSLDSSQYGHVTGQGSNPSVSNSSTILDVNQLAQDLIALGVEGVDMQTLANGNYSSGVWGTSLSPKITHITGDATLTGSLTGWGVLIIDGGMTLRGGFAFNGLVICLGDADVNGAGGGGDIAKIWGTLLIRESTSSDSSDELRIGGSGNVYYSSQALKTVTDKWPNAFSTGPRIIAWSEMMV